MTGSSHILIDTYAWVELFKGTANSSKVNALIADNECYTSAISLAELAVALLKEGKNPESYLVAVRKLSQIVDVTEETFVLAGYSNFEHRKSIKDFGLADSIIYTTASIFGFRILTGDSHFKNLENVIFLG